ncbi:MAG: tRNA (adenosine(37)-N6)-threonylcarbamoyltransferase complex transferase subunit TsaD [Terriglobales bacterium]
MERPLILGIETSCDETAAAVVAAGARRLSSVVLSQVPVHRLYGGIVPELASREHLRGIVPIVRQALERAEIALEAVDAVAVTRGPGLAGALLVGLTYAKALALAAGKPLIGVHHLAGHIHAVLLDRRERGEGEPPWPAVALVVSGGHTALFLVARRAPAAGGFAYQLLGQTRDDAAGEAGDKVAKLLGLGYPGGPLIDRLAEHGKERAVAFTRPKFKGPNDLDFSFSGLKTAVLRYTQTHPLAAGIAARRQLTANGAKPPLEELRAACDAAALDLIASFQYAVARELSEKTVAAAERYGAASILLAGGVAANRRLRRELAAVAAARGWAVMAPPIALCTDNAAMIAAAAMPQWEAGDFAAWDLAASPQLPLAAREAAPPA